MKWAQSRCQTSQSKEDNRALVDKVVGAKRLFSKGNRVLELMKATSNFIRAFIIGGSSDRTSFTKRKISLSYVCLRLFVFSFDPTLVVINGILQTINLLVSFQVFFSRKSKSTFLGFCWQSKVLYVLAYILLSLLTHKKLQKIRVCLIRRVM